MICLKMCFIFAVIYNIPGLLHFGSCDIEINRCYDSVFTLKYQMNGEEFVRDFYNGDRILKITNDYPDWTIKTFWEKNKSETSLIKVSFLKNKIPQLITLKDMKETDENLTISQEIGLTHKILLDAISTPITILSCRDLYYTFQNSVVYTLHYSNEQSLMEMSRNGPVYLMIISGELHSTVKTSKGTPCHYIFNSGDLMYVPEGISMKKSATRGRFLAIQMTWMSNPNKLKIICKPITLQSLATNDMVRNSSKYHETKSLQLGTGHSIPPLGLTITKTGKHEAKILQAALKLGYKLFHIIKTDQRNGHKTKLSSEEQLKAGMDRMRRERKEIFISIRIHIKLITHKVNIEDIVEESLKRLNSSYIDLVIIELPYKDNSMETGKNLRRIWKSLITMKTTGKIHALGVCNVKDIQQLEAIYTYEKDGLSVVENWFDLHRPDKDVRRRCRDLNIVYMAYGLLGTVRMKLKKIHFNKILTSPELKNIAGPYHLPISKLLLIWAMQKEIIVKPSTSDLDHLESNFYSTGLQIMDVQREELDDLAKSKPVGIGQVSPQKDNSKLIKDEL